jgi:hypothetical protein
MPEIHLDPSRARNNDKEIQNDQNVHYFDVDLSDGKLLLKIYDDLLKLNMEEIPNRTFLRHLLPRHRKPTFGDFVRFRRLEKIMSGAQ